MSFLRMLLGEKAKPIEAIAAQISPFDGGRTYGDIYPPKIPAAPKPTTPVVVPTMGRSGKILNQPVGSTVFGPPDGIKLYLPPHYKERRLSALALPFDPTAYPEPLQPLKPYGGY